MIRLGYDTINYIVHNIKICPFAIEQLHHRYVICNGRHHQRRPTLLLNTKGKHYFAVTPILTPISVHTYTIDEQNIKPGHLVDLNKLADAISVQTSSNIQ